VVEEIKGSDLFIEYRQIGVIDRDGNSAVYTGKENPEWKGYIAKQNYIAMGNWLANENVIKEMAEAFESSANENLEERLMSSTYCL
jgi:uncharacterized Ntn-hydrolase superfamily protein